VAELRDRRSPPSLSLTLSKPEYVQNRLVEKYYPDKRRHIMNNFIHLERYRSTE